MSDWEDECAICLKHLRQGPLAGRSSTRRSSSSPRTPRSPRRDGVYLGYLFVEPRRHISELGDLSEQEAEALGLLTMRLARILQQAQGADHVYSAVVGHHEEHLHVHLIPRYPDTPPEFWWTKVLEWPDAPRGRRRVAVSEVAARLRFALS